MGPEVVWTDLRGWVGETALWGERSMLAMGTFVVSGGWSWGNGEGNTGGMVGAVRAVRSFVEKGLRRRVCGREEVVVVVGERDAVMVEWLYYF